MAQGPRELSQDARPHARLRRAFAFHARHSHVFASPLDIIGLVGVGFRTSGGDPCQSLSSTLARLPRLMTGDWGLDSLSTHSFMKRSELSIEQIACMLLLLRHLSSNPVPIVSNTYTLMTMRLYNKWPSFLDMSTISSPNPTTLHLPPLDIQHTSYSLRLRVIQVIRC
jgi:hypothetical protein